jgi:hypothetical protein
MQITERLLIADGCPSPPCTTSLRTWVSTDARKAGYLDYWQKQPLLHLPTHLDSPHRLRVPEGPEGACKHVGGGAAAGLQQHRIVWPIVAIPTDGHLPDR